MKRTAILTVFAALPALAHSQVYLGLDVAGGTGETKFDGYRTITQDVDTAMAALKVGYITKGGSRLQLSLTNISAEQEDFEDDSDWSGIDFDFKAPFSDKTVKPYLGAGFGLYTWEDTGEDFVDGDDLKGLAINLSGGLLFEVNDHFDVEAGLQYKTIVWESIEPANSDIEVDVSTSIIQFVAGANVRF